MKKIMVLFCLTLLLGSCRNKQSNKSRTDIEDLERLNYSHNDRIVLIEHKKEEQEPSYQETADWIVSKLKLYAEGYERNEYLKRTEFETFYPNVRLTYDNFKIQYGKLFIFEQYRYYGGNLNKENGYKGFIIRQNIQEIPINNIVNFNMNQEGYRLNNSEAKFCNISFIVKNKTIKVIRNLQVTGITSNFDTDASKPITEYNAKGGLFIRCEIEKDLKDRMDKALKHLKKLNLERYPVSKEPF